MFKAMLYSLFAKIVYSADANGDPILPQDVPMPDLPPDDYGVAFVKMFLTMIALIVLFVSSIWLLRRIMKGRVNRSNGEQMIHVLEKRIISQKSILYLIEVEGQKILLAESQHEIRRLQNWTHPTESLSMENCTDTSDGSFKVP